MNNNTMIKTIGDSREPEQFIEYNGIKVRFVEIDSEKAKEYLSLSTGNRRIAPQRVNHYREMMDAGKWNPISQIILADDGSLKDGHHRLTAQASSENPSVFIEITGAKKEYLSTIDTGRPRTQTDFLKLFFESNNTEFLFKLASVSKFLISLAHRKALSNIIDYQECADFISEERESLEMAISKCYEIKKNSLSAYSSGLTAAFYKIIKRNNSLADSFFNSLLTGANLDVGSPVLALRNYLSLSSHDNSSGNLKSMNDYMVTSKAWNAYVGGVKVSRFNAKRKSKDLVSELYDIQFA